MTQRAIALALFALVGCSGPPSQILVHVRAEPGVRAVEDLLVRIEIHAAPGGDGDEFPRFVHESQMRWPDGESSIRRALTPLGGDTRRRYRFVVSGFINESEAASNAPFVRSVLISGYVPGETREVTVWLFDNCRDNVCLDLSSTCDPMTRECVDAWVAPGEQPFQRPSCATADDCDDGIACTTDICAAGSCRYTTDDALCDETGRCLSGRCTLAGCMYEPHDELCDDLIGCTVDTCTPDGSCTFTPDHGQCTAGEDGVCDVVTGGCQYSTCDEETCSAESGCETATCDGDTCRRANACIATEQECCGNTCVPVGCSDSVGCTVDACNEVTGMCEHTPDHASCADAYTCTENVCDPIRDCLLPTYNDALCPDDGDACTVEFCGETDCDEMTLPDESSCGPSGSCDVCNGGTCQRRNCGCTDAASCPVRPCETAICDAGTCQYTQISGCERCPPASGNECYGSCCGTNCCVDVAEVCIMDAGAPFCCDAGQECNGACCSGGRSCTNDGCCDSDKVCGTGPSCCGPSEECSGGTCMPIGGDPDTGADTGATPPDAGTSDVLSGT